jgi:hypothetical protein
MRGFFANKLPAQQEAFGSLYGHWKITGENSVHNQYSSFSICAGL